MKRLLRNLLDNSFVVLATLALVALALVKGAEALQTVSSGGGGGGSASAPLELDQTGNVVGWFTTGTAINEWAYDVQATYSVTAFGGLDAALHGSTSGDEIWWVAADDKTVNDLGGVLILRAPSDAGPKAQLNNVVSGGVIEVGGADGSAGVGTGTQVNITSPVTIEGRFVRRVQTLATTQTIDTANGSHVVCNTTGGTITLTLPAAIAGETVQIANNSANTCTLAVSSGTLHQSGPFAAAGGQAYCFSDGTDWFCHSR